MRRGPNGVLLLALALVAGCYSPKVKNRGFACDGTYAGACPAGFACINGVCDDGSGGSGPPPGADMATDGTGGNGSGDMAGASDMAKAGTVDLAMPPAPDLAHPPPPDMASSCAHSPCMTGSRLNSSCDPCVSQVCSADPLCCSGTWDAICVGEVTSICGRSCP